MKMFDVEAFRLKCLSDPLVENVWSNKYRWNSERSIRESQTRVVGSVCENEPPEIVHEIMDMVTNGYFLPAGRINAGAGTGRNVTLMNCYVGDTIQDSMPGIQCAIAKSAFTLQQGGGIGNDFSTIRPAGALVKRTGSVASGAIAFMDQMSAMSDTVCSAGERRGAMMTTLADFHADLWGPEQFETMTNYAGDQILKRPSFISVKRQKGRMTQTNISVLVSDAFMKAVADDTDWDLGFWEPRADGVHVDVYDKPFPYNYYEMDNDFNASSLSEDIRGRRKGEMLPFYVYQRVPARRIWEDLMRSTYKYAEPGVIFIDRINERNNLNYCEEIRCTNPCGEQCLPSFGTCCLGSINVAFMVTNPFTINTQFNMDIFKRAVFLGIRFLDNVLDVSQYPLDEQREESMAKRRIGLGLTGVADALLQMKMRYGSEQAVQWMRLLSRHLQAYSYEASAELAAQRGSFPLYNREKFAQSYNYGLLPKHVQQKINDHGIRNGVLNTVAPNGTISIYSGNTAQGVEPVFSFLPVQRKVRQPDGTLVEYLSMNYSQRLYREMFLDADDLPDYFVGALDLTAEAHVAMQAACQEHIDASLSKTVNCPASMSFEDFKSVYTQAYDSGCKGCTTYRPDPDSGRGSVLSTEPEDGSVSAKQFIEADEFAMNLIEQITTSQVPTRGRILAGQTYKLKWPITGENWYVTINHDEAGKPVEVFITTAAAEYSEWVQAISRLLTAILRRGGDTKFLLAELEAIHSAKGGGFIADQQKFRPSIVAAIGGLLEEEFNRLTSYEAPVAIETIPQPKIVPVTVTYGNGPDACPNCHATPLVHEVGCARCLNCDWSNCG